MGTMVKSPLRSSCLKITGYALNVMRSDFMDIFLDANCEFAITNRNRMDAVPVIFQRPIIRVNGVPLGYCPTYG
jgi:putative glycosyltransferase (TIGR04372 family)